MENFMNKEPVSELEIKGLKAEATHLILKNIIKALNGYNNSQLQMEKRMEIIENNPEFFKYFNTEEMIILLELEQYYKATAAQRKSLEKPQINFAKAPKGYPPMVHWRPDNFFDSKLWVRILGYGDMGAYSDIVSEEQFHEIQNNLLGDNNVG